VAALYVIPAHDGVPRFTHGTAKWCEVRHQGAIEIPIPIITSDTTITNRSIVSQVGMRFAGCCVMAGPSAARILCQKKPSGCE
jgi:hypothetical protein